MYRLVYIILYMLYKLIRKSFRLTTVYIYRECIQIHVLLVLHIDDIQYKSNVNKKERHLILLYTIFQISALYLPLFGVGGGEVFQRRGDILTYISVYIEVCIWSISLSLSVFPSLSLSFSPIISPALYIMSLLYMYKYLPLNLLSIYSNKM